MSISSIGVGSGLPLGDLLAQLRASQETKLVAIEQRQTKAEARVSGYGQLKVELENLAKAAKALEGSAFETLKTTVTGKDFTATSKNGAVEVSYEIKVQQLASAQSLVTDGIASKTAGNGTGGVIQFTVDGEIKEIDLTGKGTSLNDVVKAINEAKDADGKSLGLQASVVNNGSDEPFQLMISTKDTGLDASITKLEVQGNTDLNNVLKFGVTGSTVTEKAATNAELTVNGIDITSQSNTVDGALENVTLTLTGATNEPGKMVIEQDKESITKAVESFVNAYNDVHKKIKQLTNYDVEAQKGSALVGDSLTRSVQTRLATILNTESSGAFSMLSQIGIRTQEGGLLSLDKTKLQEAIASNAKGVETLFKAENGVSARTKDITSQFTKTDGLLSNAVKGAEKSVESIKEQFESAVARIDAQMETYRKQFTAMDALVAQMNSTSSYLAQQLANLGKNTA